MAIETKINKTQRGENMRESQRLTVKDRRTVYDKMGGRCAYCGEILDYKDMQVDHFLPVRGGEDRDNLDNMLPACRSCNHYKRGNTLEGWRKMLEATPTVLERDCYTYRQAVRFGMVTPTPRKVVFYFEKVHSSTVSKGDMIEFG